MYIPQSYIRKNKTFAYAYMFKLLQTFKRAVLPRGVITCMYKKVNLGVVRPAANQDVL